MKRMRLEWLKTVRIILALSLAIGGLAPQEASAGGGGGGKSRNGVKIKNTSTASAAAPLISIDTVAIGDAGNAPATFSYLPVGAVSYPFRLSTHEVTIADYTVFLNAVATRADGANSQVVESLYDSRMLSDTNIAGISRNGSGTAASPYAYFVVGDGKKPISYITWFNAARFANWMHNGASATADIEDGAYPLMGMLSGLVAKNEGAVWWIPTQDEWFKAAYYKGGSLDAGYWLFPTKSDSLPSNNDSTAANQANFQRLELFCVTQSNMLDSAQNYLTAVGTFTNSPGPYGTFDQGGNVEEWTDSGLSTDFGEARITRGGAWNSGGLNNDVATIPTALPTDRSSKVGFRLARAAITAETPQTLSGVIAVKVSGSLADFTTIAPSAVRSFAIRAGTYTVEARDAHNVTVTTSKTFTARDRTSFVTVSVNGNQIVIAEAPLGTSF